jgi:hypothetical protein
VALMRKGNLPPSQAEFALLDAYVVVSEFKEGTGLVIEVVASAQRREQALDIPVIKRTLHPTHFCQDMGVF